MEVRQRHVNQEVNESFIDKVQKFDAFPKYPPECTTSTASGGGMSVVTFLLLFLLTFSEIRNYFETRMSLQFDLDKDFEKPIKINMDFIVATPCSMIGGDVIDITGKSTIESDNSLREEETIFQLTEAQDTYFKSLRLMNTFLKSSQIAVHKMLWKHSFAGFRSMLNNDFPEQDNNPNVNKDACRFRGSVIVPKVGGNFHVVAGKPIQFSNGAHAHITFFGSNKEANFSHRILHLSFGDETVSRIHPLDGDEQVSSQGSQSYQYFVNVVPTRIRTRSAQVDSYQFSVTEHHRVIDHQLGSHGNPGIFIRYDFFPLMVKVIEDYDSVGSLFIRWAAGVGGIFATSALIHRIVAMLVDLVCCRLNFAAYQGSLVVNSPVT